MQLYQLSDSIRQILSTEDSDGELLPAFADELGKLDMQFNEKSLEIAAYVKEVQAEAEGVKLEAVRLKERQTRLERKADWLKAYLLENMEKLGVQKIPGLLVSLRIQKNSRPSIFVEEGKTIPEEYQRIKVELDGQKAYTDWKEIGTLPDSIMVKEGRHLRIT